MKAELLNATELLESSQLSTVPDISKAEYQKLGRIDRIYNAIMYPRHFQMTDADESYLEMMKKAYNLLLATPTEHQARQLIRQVNLNKTLSMADTMELIRSTKELFGKIEIRDVTFDRAVMRHRLQDLYHRAKLAGDIKNERLALKQLVDLDDLAVKDAKVLGPVIPPLPDVQMECFQDDPLPKFEGAIIESLPDASSEE